MDVPHFVYSSVKGRLSCFSFFELFLLFMHHVPTNVCVLYVCVDRHTFLGVSDTCIGVELHSYIVALFIFFFGFFEELRDF